MHIAYLISQYPAVSHTFVQREILAMRGLGWTITTISIRRAQSGDLLTPTDRSEADGTHVIVPPNLFHFIAAFFAALQHPVSLWQTLTTAWRLRRPGLRGAAWAIFYLGEAMMVHRIASRKGVTHYHAHFANVACDVAMLAALLDSTPTQNRKTFSFTMHGPTEFADAALHRLQEKSRAAKFIICISDFARSQLMALLPCGLWNKLHVVRCGVDPMQFTTPPPSPPLERDSQAKITHIFTIARLSPVKAHPILFRAVDELLLRGHEVRLVLAGDGPCRRELEHLADTMGLRQRIRFAGNVGQDRIPQLLSEADLFVLPSFAEGLPVVLMEAMAAGCPVVATRIAGIPELIEDGRSGLLVPPGRADLLADAMERLISAPAFAQRLVAEGLRKIHGDFDLRATSVRLSAVFRAYLRKREAAL
ncbi:MAG: glycosyltransferase family 4 protein [Phycisphaerales bacterium]|nr:glycosyltransferase family 4 protein [Phycisphaerales bacterium]